MIQIKIPITTNTAMIPTAAPALNIPPITEHPLKAITAKTKSNTFNFFMVFNCRVYTNYLFTKTKPCIKNWH